MNYISIIVIFISYLHYKYNHKKHYDMVIAEKRKEISFREWYDSLDTLKKREFRDEFIRVSGMQFSTFYSKLQRNCSFSPLEQEAIQRIVGNQIQIKFPHIKAI